MVILAHTSTNKVIFQIRNFDVTLLVIISGMLGAINYDKNYSIFQYIKKRFVRLVIPAWLFLTFFFSLIFILDRLTIKTDILTLKNIIGSYLCLGGIGYVWIIRIYILCAISLPLIILMINKFGMKKSGYIILFIYLLYEITYYFIGDFDPFFKYIIYYFIPYGILCTYLGILFRDIDEKKLLIISIALIVIFLLTAIFFINYNGNFINSNEYKYPPRLYYLSYSIGMTGLLFYLVDKKNFCNIKEKSSTPLIQFISRHSMWIYLWHIPFTFLCTKAFSNISWILKYIIMLLGAITLTYLQTLILKTLKVSNKTILAIFNG